MVIVEGAGGIGKSRLLDEIADLSAGFGAHVARATAATGQGVVAMGPLLQAVAGGDQALLTGADVPRDDAAADGRYWLIQEFETSLERRSAAGPAVIVLDDLQWADAGTVAAVELLSERLADLPLAWIVALRPAEASRELTSALDRMVALGAHRIRLGPLGDDAVREMVTDLVGAPPDTTMSELAASARGVPFWLAELLNALLESDRIEHVDGRAGVRPGELPPRIWDTTRDRLEKMTPGARAVVSVASVLGRRVTFDALERMLDATPADLLLPIEELLVSGLLVEEGEDLVFRHDLLREGVLSTLPAPARRSLERQAVDVLLASGAPPVEVALRLADSARFGDVRAIELLIRVIQTLGGSDPNAAAGLAERTLELTPSDDPRRASLVAKTAILLHAAGHVEEAVRFADTALSELSSPAAQSQVRFGIASMFTLSADVRAEANRRALALEGLDDQDRARHRASLIHNVLAAGRHHEARQLLMEIDAPVRASADHGALFMLTLAEGGVRYGQGRFGESLALVERGIRMAAAAGDEARTRIAEQWRSEVLGVLDRFPEAIRISENGLVESQRQSQAWAIHLWEQWRGRQMCLLGNYDDAIAMLEDTFRTGEVRAAFGANDASALSAMASAALHVGDWQISTRCQEIARLTLRGATPELRRHAGWILAEAAMAAGDVEEAHAQLTHLVAGVAPDEPILPSFPSDVTNEAQVVRIALAAGDERLAQRAVALAEERASLNPDVASIVGAARHARGLLDSDLSVLEAAVEAYRTSPRRMALAFALEDAAVCALAQDLRHQSIEYLAQALELVSAMNARSDANRLRQRLRGLGVRQRVLVADRPTHGWAALTPSELAVVRAITGGMTNREAAEALFLSPHTVGSHLRHVFSKLNINSRVELTRMSGEYANEIATTRKLPGHR